MRNRSNVLLTVLMVVLVLCVGIGAYHIVNGHGSATVGGPFALIDGDGHTRTDKDFAGRWMLVYFGYTHCPDACPTTLNMLAEALDKIPAGTRAKIVPLFITVDPARDNPAAMKAYAESFGPEFVGLTGNDDQIKQAEQAYRVYAARLPSDANGDYAMDHSSIVYIIGPDGTYRGTFDDTAAASDVAKKLDGMVAG